MKPTQSDIAEYVEHYRPYHRAGDEDLYWLAACYIRLGDFARAHQLFTTAMNAMLQPRPYWRKIAAPDMIVNALILVSRPDLAQRARDALHSFRDQESHAIAYSPLASYAYAMMEVLDSSGEDIERWLSAALAKPKYKDTYASATAIRALIHRDKSGLQSGISNVLLTYERQITRGGLRQASLPFRVLSMDAMCILYLSRHAGMLVEASSEFISTGYLDFLQQDR